jgi:hypothetical protein
VFENRVLRGTFGRKSEEVAGGWRSLSNEELHKLYFSPNILREMRWAVYGPRMGEMRNAYKILV